MACRIDRKREISPISNAQVSVVVDLVVNRIEFGVRPLEIERFRLGYEYRYIGLFADDNFQDAVINGRRAKQSVVEIESRDPFAIDADLSDRDLLRALLDGADLDRADAICESVLLRLNQGIDRPKEIVEGTGQVWITLHCGRSVTV